MDFRLLFSTLEMATREATPEELERVARFAHAALNNYFDILARVQAAAVQDTQPSADETKPSQYDFITACDEVDSARTITCKDAKSPNYFKTLFSETDTKAILRGESVEDFPLEFLARAIYHFLGREVHSFTTRDGRLEVVHA